MTLLHGRLELRGVDAEKLAQKVVGNWLRNKQAHLEQADHDDLVAFLTSEIWRFSLNFDPALANVSFSTYAFRLANARVVDWYRSRYGRSRWQFGNGTVYERARPVPLSLDAQSPEGDSLGATLEGRTGDLAGDCDPELARLFVCGDRTRAEDQELVRALVA